MSNLIDFGKKIKQRRLELGLTQDELAHKTGYTSRSSINKIELGLVDLPQSKISAIAGALGVSPTYLLGWENNNSGVNNGIVGDKNHHNTIIVDNAADSVGEIETELLALCKKMTMQQKIELLSTAYKIVDNK